VQVACVVSGANLVAPVLQGGVHYDLSALAMLLRDWSSEELLWEIPFATFLITENQNDLHPLLQNNPRAAHIEVPLPAEPELAAALEVFAERFPTALQQYGAEPARAAGALVGATLSSVESLLKTKEYERDPIDGRDLVALKKQLVERDANDLIEFVKPDRSLDDYHGQGAVKDWLRKDLQLWGQGDLAALPMGYLLCGPVGTGKTYLVECLAGEADVPVVKFKNFRDKWVGSTEGNLERIFRLLHALGRCIVFIDEADQALGRRTGGSGDSGVSGRVYSMMADEMSDTRNRGRIVWVLASSRPDLIEVDLKRPGRVDVKIPLFPTTDAREAFALIRALCLKRGVAVPESAWSALEPLVPVSITPGSAEALAVKVYRTVRTEGSAPTDALAACLADWRSPVPAAVMDFQIGLAAQEASDFSFVPEAFRGHAEPTRS
jgi:SpoVK/Ycf46/Vps4 family AAA+-type ATPase